VRIVDFTSDRREDFARLNLEWLERWFTVEAIDHDVLGDPETHILAGGGRILFAIDDVGDVLGTVALKREGAGVYELTKMAVSPEARGTGAGRLLANAAITAFTEAGGSRLYLETNTRLAPAIALYESVGFEHVPLRTDSPYARADVHMVWKPAGGTTNANPS
jgi:putative acetyltransferase